MSLLYLELLPSSATKGDIVHLFCGAVRLVREPQFLAGQRFIGRNARPLLLRHGDAEIDGVPTVSPFFLRWADGINTRWPSLETGFQIKFGSFMPSPSRVSLREQSTECPPRHGQGTNHR